jgi:hypothetical protein
MTGPPARDPLAELRRLYFRTSPATVQRDLMAAIALFKRLTTEEQRERAAVYMDGLSQLRSEWAGRSRPPQRR